MTAHSETCDGWHYVGKGALPNLEDDSVPCTGQCINREAQLADHDQPCPNCEQLSGHAPWC